MPRLPSLLVLALAAADAQACIPPPPTLLLNGESDGDHAARARAFNDAIRDEDGRRQQTRWFAAATRFRLARATGAIRLPQLLSDGMSQVRRVEAVPLASFKGKGTAGGTLAIQNVVADTCGIFGGGTATAGKPGDYVVTFENVQDQGTGHVGFLLRDLREPRIIQQFDAVVQRAQRAPPAP